MKIVKLPKVRFYNYGPTQIAHVINGVRHTKLVNMFRQFSIGNSEALFYPEAGDGINFNVEELKEIIKEMEKMQKCRT